MSSNNPNQSRRERIDAIERDILSLTSGIHRATYRLLVLVREFDERAGYLRWSLQSAAEWLAWRCDIGLSAAREKVRVAHALKVLPAISEAFAAGSLSYSKVRALTRVAGPDNEATLLAYALGHTADNVEQRCRELRFGHDASTDLAQRAYEMRSLRILREADRNRMTITVELPLDMGVRVEKALDKARDANPKADVDSKSSWQTQQADAFVEVIDGYLIGNLSDEQSDTPSDRYLVNVHVEHSALAGQPGRAALPIESMKRLCCDGKAIVITENEKGEPLSIGRKSRIIPKSIERALRARDNHGCRFPGCHHTRYLAGHHIHHWSAGGETSLDNLMLLCSKHHRLVHEGRYRILKDFQDRWFFARPDGVAIPDNGFAEVSDTDNYPSAEGLPVKPCRRVAEPAPVYLH